MNREIQYKLLQINQQFYQSYADSFSFTRSQVQPGVRILIDSIPQDAAILDVGCGNGTLARALEACSFRGSYYGVDMSAELLENARGSLQNTALNQFRFQQVDLADQDWVDHLSGRDYDWLVSFAVLHHLPGVELRRRTASSFAKLVSPKCKVAVSVWQWQNSPRLRSHVLPWQTVGLNSEDVDEGDVLLDWRAGVTPGVRYVHTFTENSLSILGKSAGFRVVDSFYSDGKPGNLALYQIWELPGK
jgi:SAM-dependent methyltransferase